jgi:hypothetical protein
VKTGETVRELPISNFIAGVHMRQENVVQRDWAFVRPRQALALESY